MSQYILDFIKKVFIWSLFFTVIISPNDNLYGISASFELPDNWDANDRYALRGNWFFIPRVFLTPDTFSYDELRAAYSLRIPDSWDSLDVDFAVRNWGTYVAIIDGVPKSQAIAFSDILGVEAIRIWGFDPEKVNTGVKPLAQIGSPGTKENSSKPKFVQGSGIFPISESGRLIMLINISSFKSTWGGIRSEPILSSVQSMTLRNQWQKYENFFLLGIFLVVAVLHIVIFLQLRKDWPSLWMAVFTLAIAVRYIATENLIESLLPYQSDLAFSVSVMLKNFMMPFALASYMSFYFYSFPSLIRKGFLYIAWGTSVTYMLVIVGFDHYLASSIWVPVYVISLLLTIYLIIIEVIALRSRERGSKFALLAMIILMAASVNDFLVFTVVMDGFYFVHWATIIFIVINAHINSLRLSSVIEERSEHLNNLNAAEIVQKSLLPVGFPSQYLDIQTTYRSCDRVGGDWFNWHHSKDKGWFIVTLGDVTGHGLASAMITATITGAFRSSCLVADNSPDNDLETVIRMYRDNMNRVLFNNSFSQKMMTLTIVGLDLVRNRGFYINSGHEPTYLKQEGRLRSLLYPGTPLGVSEQSVAKILEFKFHPGDQMFLYTDGITECHPYLSRNKAARLLKNTLDTSTDIEQLQNLLIQNFIFEDQPIDDDCSWVLLERIA